MTPTDAVNVANFLHHCANDEGQTLEGKAMLNAVQSHLFGVANNGIPTGVESDICNLITQRQTLGISKYGQTVADNPLPLRAWLQHALEECLDQAIYLKRAINEIDMGAAG